MTRPYQAIVSHGPLNADGTRRPLDQLREYCAHLVVLGWVDALRSDFAVLAAEEQQPTQRRVAAVPGCGPPQDSLVLGSGEGYVGQSQVLPPLLGEVLLLVTEKLQAAATHVNPPLTIGIVED